MRNNMIAFLAVACLTLTARAEGPLNVVTTLSTYADLVKTIGGEFVDVTYIAPPKFNPHFIEPRPSHVLSVKRADLFVHTGLDLELWRFPLVDAAANPDVRPGGSKELDLSKGIRLLEVPDRNRTRAEGDIHLYGNPHYWLDPRNGLIMASTITDKLSAIDPDHEPEYRSRYADFKARLESRIAQWQSELPAESAIEILGYHNQWPYFLAFAGLEMRQFIEPKPGIPPSPKHLKFLENYINQNHIRVIAYSQIFSARAAKTLSKRTGVSVVVLAQNVGEFPETKEYISMIEYNVQQLLGVLR